MPSRTSPPGSPPASSKQHRPMPAPAPLWAHLLSKSTSSTLTHSPSSVAPHTQIAPVDRAGTSTRILLLDTHARLETFSDHVSRLTEGVERAQKDVQSARDDIQMEREKFSEELVQLGM